MVLNESHKTPKEGLSERGHSNGTRREVNRRIAAGEDPESVIMTVQDSGERTRLRRIHNIPSPPQGRPITPQSQIARGLMQYKNYTRKQAAEETGVSRTTAQRGAKALSDAKVIEVEKVKPGKPGKPESDRAKEVREEAQIAMSRGGSGDALRVIRYSGLDRTERRRLMRKLHL